jgi:hypothetical protein
MLTRCLEEQISSLQSRVPATHDVFAKQGDFTAIYMLNQTGKMIVPEEKNT